MNKAYIMKAMFATLAILAISWSPPCRTPGSKGLWIIPYRGRLGHITHIVNGQRGRQELYDMNVQFDLDNTSMTMTKYEYPQGGSKNDDTHPVSYTYTADQNNQRFFYIKKDYKTIGYLYVDDDRRQLILDITVNSSNRYIIIWDKTN
jgi:hypothetical protein